MNQKVLVSFIRERSRSFRKEDHAAYYQGELKKCNLMMDGEAVPLLRFSGFEVEWQPDMVYNCSGIVIITLPSSSRISMYMNLSG